MAGLAAPTTATAAPGAGGAAPAPTVEERRLDGEVPQEILRRSGFAAVAPAFARGLGRADSYREARAVVAREGAALWRRAVDRVQGAVRPAGTSAGTTTGRCTGRGSG